MSKKNTFMNNVLIILFSQVAVKVLGLVYRMVITNISGFGDAGNGYYNTGFQVYTLLLAISSVGIPNAISKMTSERAALGDWKGAHKIFKTAMVLFFVIGLVCAAILFFGADFIVGTILGQAEADGAKYVLKALAPSVIFVCMSAVIRGYFTGMSNMKATSMSQVLEQVFKCVFTVGIVWVMAGFSIYANAEVKAYSLAAGANFASTIATVLSFIYLIYFYNKNKRGIWQHVQNSTGETVNLPFGKMCKSILVISIPISLGGIISAINRIVDTATITRGIEIAFAAAIPAHGNVAEIINPTLKQLNEEAVRLSGILSKSDTLLNLPIAMNIAFATVLVPAIAGALAVGNKKEASEKISYSFLISILIIFPCAVGYIVMAQPIYKLLYPNAMLGSDLLQISSIALIFIALNQTISGSLQGIGKIFVPATGLLMGCIAKFILNVVLIRQPSINIYGAPISSIVCQVISFSYGFTVLCKQTSVKLGFGKYIAKPLTAAIVMGACAVGVYKFAMYACHINIISLFAAIAAAAVVYLLTVLKLNILSADEIEQLPAGGMILKKLQGLGFYKDEM